MERAADCWPETPTEDVECLETWLKAGARGRLLAGDTNREYGVFGDWAQCRSKGFRVRR